MDLPLEQSVDAWIDSNRLMRKIISLGRFVFMTDGAIGRREEPNLRHVTINLGAEADRSRIIPILTTKHTLEYCLEFAERSYTFGFTSLVVSGATKAMLFLAASNTPMSCANSSGSRCRESRWEDGPIRTGVAGKSNSCWTRIIRPIFTSRRSSRIISRMRSTSSSKKPNA